MQRLDGKIVQIQRFCTHDGPGIRTVLFLKGCPLRCQWCANPESQSLHADILFDPHKCIACGRCVVACPQRIPIGSHGIAPNCTWCGKCTQACPSHALELVGTTYSVAEIMEEVARDEAFYGTDGGVTISGGEPLMHPDLVCNLADEVKKAGYHLAIETTGFADWNIVDRIFPRVDLILYDIKQMNDAKHLRYTGVSNRRILENAGRAVQKGYPVMVRVPLMGGLNDDEENITQLAEFCAKIGVKEVEFLPYHNWGEAKYRMLQRGYYCTATRPTLERRQQLALILAGYGIHVRVGHA